MATTVEKLWKGATGTANSAVAVDYVVRGAADEDEAKVAALTDIPSTQFGLTLKNVEHRDRLAEDTWTFTANYYVAPNTSQPTPDTTFTFDAMASTQHITQSISTVNSYGPEKTALFAGAIGYDGNNVAGCDIYAPSMQFTETHFFTDAEMTWAFRRTLSRMGGKVNNAAFRGYDAGEVLFLGARGDRRGDDWDDEWEVQFIFAVQENRTGLSVGAITGIAKWGWEYLWVQYAEVKDTVNSKLLKYPVAAYVEQVYHTTDFAALGIGTAEL